MGQLFSWFSGTRPELQSKDLEGVAQYIASGKCKNIFIMAGAGISRAAGIPDFRSPGGLYETLRKSDVELPRPLDIFTLSYFKKNPKPFYRVMSELYGGTYRPTLTHSFIRLLEERRLLNTCWTQNVDDLERLAGVSSWRLVQAHGSLDSQHCTTCHAKLDDRAMKQAVVSGEVPLCAKPGCKGFVKPDVVMFGEALPSKFWLNIPFMWRADLLIIVGTSLAVPPFSQLADRVPVNCPRVVINTEPVSLWAVGARESDVKVVGDCDETVRRLAQLMGGDWEERLDALWQGTEDKVFRYKDHVTL
ncbi:DHS-like NAD/FAD-binding domain-containing protein [Mycena alexandri]|uniref:DHS-like NAD/FAD-binding domain-containing protein n=1 Tax=Mycena alexandri TaxID=1745969 RepID=A0AAD6T6G2_9AGAR|nr:DHS-like NAD/FAD-binding domain-containing protein [Mycena alexandri]